MLFGNMRKRHILLLTGIAALVFGAILMSVTISRIYWYSPIYFYRYTAHPFTAVGVFLCSLGGLLILLYILIRLWDMFKARRAAREAAARKAKAESQKEAQGEPTPAEQ